MNVIMIVEDELLEREFLEIVVRDQLMPGDRVVSCGTGVEAIELAKTHRPNIIFMDMMIPELDGITAIQEIRKFLPEACITILTAYSDFSYAQKAIRLQVFDYLLKPVKPAAFKELIANMLTAQSPKAEPEIEVKVETDAETPAKRHIFIEEALKYIDEHYREKLTLEMVASKVFVNPKYFSHIFKQEVGVSFTDYFIQLRMEYACKLLETTKYQAYRISNECGFSDPSYFNRVFCAKMKMTPQTYRKSAKTLKQDGKLPVS